MRRSSSVAILAVCFVLLGGTVLATAGSIAIGAWQPVWDRPDPTPNPNQPGPGGPGPGGLGDELGYDEFLADVRSGGVFNVDQEGSKLIVSTEFGQYVVEVPDESTDVFGDMSVAAAEGGVPVPSYSLNGNMEDLGTRSYDELLADVTAGKVQYVGQYGADLTCNVANGYYVVHLDDPDRNVLADIEAAARAAGVRPPSYSKDPVF